MQQRHWDLLNAIQFFLAGACAALSGYNLLGALLAALGLGSLVSFLGVPTLELLELLVGAIGGFLAAYRFSRAPK